MKRPTVQWLDRRISAPGPYLTLCMSEAEFRAALAPLAPPSVPAWMTRGADATTHFFDNQDKKTCAFVCLGDPKDRNAIEIAGLLVHEAVHVWQQHAFDIGERKPGDEQEAYAVQAIAQELLAEFARRMG